MALHDPCPECGVIDALGRHDGTCPRALEIGLPRLADGEEPIDPLVDEQEQESLRQMREDDQQQQGQSEPDPLLRIARDRDIAVTTEPITPRLWMSYFTDEGGGSFDAVVFDAEIDALRHAVAAHWQVLEVQLGQSLVEQVQDH